VCYFKRMRPYYLLRVILPFDVSSDTGGMRREEESSACERLIHVGMMSCPILIDQMMLR
jgi:hypothetical protein